MRIYTLKLITTLINFGILVHCTTNTHDNNKIYQATKDDKSIILYYVTVKDTLDNKWKKTVL